MEDHGDLELSGLEQLLKPRVLTMLRQVELTGLLRIDEEGPAVVPIALRKAVARGVILATAYLVGGLEER